MKQIQIPEIPVHNVKIFFILNLSLSVGRPGFWLGISAKLQ